MSKFYVPQGIGSDYKYIVPSGDYYDLYNTTYINPNESVQYYRFYNSIDVDLYTTNYRTAGYTGTILNYIEIEPTSDYWCRPDYPSILECVLILTLGFLFLINVFTSLFRKGGLFGGII